MIIYFSATGNCKYVAERIASAYGEKAISITECIAQKLYDFTDEQIGIISPTYDFGLPSIVREFLSSANLKANYLYFVATYGTTPGAIAHFAKKYAGVNFNAYYSVKMPDTWTVKYDLSTAEKVSSFTKTTETDIMFVIDKIKCKTQGKYMKNTVPVPIAKLVYPFYEKVRQTKHFNVDDTCIGCGICARKCPIEAIEIKDKKPVWVKDKCVMCLGCLHRCPKFSIQYDNKTREHGQYTNHNVKL